MQYAAHLPNTRRLLAPVLAFAVGAAGAVGTYAILDETDVFVQPTRVIVSDQPLPTSSLSGKNEDASAAAIGTRVPFPGKNEAASAAAIGATVGVVGKDEAATAAAIGSDTPLPPGGGPPAESRSSDTGSVNRGEQLRADPHGPAATLRSR